MSRAHRIVIFTTAALVAAVLAAPHVANYVLRAPSTKESADHDKLLAAFGVNEAFDVRELTSISAAFACVLGEYASDPGQIISAYSQKMGYKVEETVDFSGDLIRPGSWALAVFHHDGAHQTLHLNEAHLRYRLAEEDAYGWCFEADQLIRLSGDFIHFPGQRPAQEDQMSGFTSQFPETNGTHPE